MKVRLTKAQEAAFEVYVSDPAHVNPEELLVSSFLKGAVLEFDAGHRDAVWRVLCEASNSADAEIDHVDDPKAARGAAVALANLGSKVLRL